MNPEIEEKLLQLQRYQEKQMKQEKTAEIPVQPQVATSIVAKVPAKKRPSPTSPVVSGQQQGASVKDEWESPPKRKVPKLDTKDAK